MRSCVLLVASLVIGLPAFAEEATFQDELAEKAAQYEDVFKGTAHFVESGEVQTAIKQLLDLRIQDNSPALAFTLGNMLYGVDPEDSYDLHRQSYEARPAEPIVALEWAMERHRKGEYAESIPLYEHFLKQADDNKRLHALLADCLVQEGRLDEAVAAWEAAEHPRNHTGIDFAICDIYGEMAPERKRADLIQRIKQGETELAEELIKQDLNMVSNWWNSRVSQESLKQDLPLIEQAIAQDQPRLKAIHCLVAIRSIDEPTADQIRSELKKANLIVDDGKLPDNSTITTALLGLAIEHAVETRQKLLEKFGPQLMARAKSKAGDRMALHALCNMSVDQEHKIAEFDRYGWQRYADPRFAGSLLVALARDQKLKSDSPELKQALKDFPLDSFINQIALSTAGKGNVTKDMLVSAIKSEYHRLSHGIGGYPDSYRLKAYFHLLKEKL